VSVRFETKPIGEVCTFYNGLWTGKKPPYVTAGVFRNTDFGRDGQLKDSEVAVLQVEEKQLVKRRLQFGDIILEKSGGGPKQAVGRVAFYDKTEGVYSFSNFTSAIRVNDTNQLLPQYLLKFLFWTYQCGVTEGMQSHSTGIRNLNADAYKQIEVPIPPLEEQRRIVAVLDKAFAGIATATANAEKNLTNARSLFESYLEAIATGQGDGWAVTPLGDVCETQYGISGTMNTSGLGYKIFRMGEVQDGRMIDTGQMKHIDIPDTEFETYRLRKGDVLFNRTNSIALVGKTGVFSLDGQYCFASYLIRVKFDAKKMSSRFAGYVMNSKSFLERVRAKAAQSVNQANINATILRAEVISYPVEVAVQNEIIDRLDAFSAHIQSLQLVYQKKLTSLTELKQSLLQKAFAGELI